MSRKSPISASLICIAVVALAAAAVGLSAWACPFCSAVALTLSEEIDNSQVAVIGKLVQLPPPSNDEPGSSLDAVPARFEVEKVIKGDEALGKARLIEAVYFGSATLGSKFLLLGLDPPEIAWGTPIAIGDRGQAYVEKANLLPKEGNAERLAFFQEYLEDADETLSRDAYDEFAKVSYAGVHSLKDRMHHDKLVEWIKNPQIPSSRRRLYLTMLGICGQPQDVAVLEEMIKSKDRQNRGALDALVACYLTLKGPDGMPMVEDLFLKDKDAEYTDTYATIIALRFHGSEETIVPRERLLQGLRYMLNRPQLADLIIPDLARWEDWSAMDRLVELFKNADEESNWVRVPVITYLRACPLPEAKDHIAELAKVDPESVKRAETFYPFAASTPAANPSGGAAPAAAAATAAGGKSTADSGAAAEAAAPVAAVAVNNGPVVGGLLAAAAAFAIAFWVILRGGQRTAVESR